MMFRRNQRPPDVAGTTSAASDAILARLLDLHPKIIDLSLDRMVRLLDALGNPERNLPPVIHIAGTNGKGSTGAFLRAGLEAAGKTVHAYTSPHLARFHERIRLAGKLISEDDLADLLAECEAANEDNAITFFEVTTVAALLAFSRIPADYCILEVGLGGRLDATNIIGSPALSIITPVSLDHQSYLGNTLAEIAGEKAGIIKPSVPVIVGRQEEEALKVIADTAIRNRAPVHAFGADWSIRRESDGFSIQYPDGLLDLPRPVLPGDHQFENAGAAIMALSLLDLDSEHVATQAVTRAEWPARMQRLREGPLLDAAPDGSEVWLDGGHNPAAGEAIATLIADMEEQTPKPFYMICGMLNTKDPMGYLEPFLGLVRRIYCVSIPGETATLEAEDLMDVALDADIDAIAVEDVATAIRLIAGEESTDLEPPRILICGSLYLAGRILRENG